MCLDVYPASKLYLLFNKLLDSPFPLEAQDKGDTSLLPRMLNHREIDMRDRSVSDTVHTNKTIDLFKKYLSKVKPQK
jgi:hypothetical protein